MKKVSIVNALLACGSDPNVLDADGETAFSHLVKCLKEVDPEVTSIVNIFSNTLRGMRFAGIHISPKNTVAHKKIDSMIKKALPLQFADIDVEKFANNVLHADIEKLATFNYSGTSIRLNEILFDETFAAYYFMTEDARQTMDKLFRENVKVLQDNFKISTIGLLFLQYRKAVEKKN